jgi:hypothetical protein
MLLQNAGLPGVGLGGIFYLIAALSMPLVEAVRALRARRGGRPRESRWRLALRQAALALGVLGAMWVTGALLASDAVEPVARRALAAAGAGAGAAEASPVRVDTLALSLALLVVLLCVVEVARVATRRRAPAPAREDAAPAPRGRRDAA